jgi:hypothetical protein
MTSAEAQRLRRLRDLDRAAGNAPATWAIMAKPARVYETRATVREGLCCCPSCIAVFPARAALKPEIAARTRARVVRVKLDDEPRYAEWRREATP